MGNALNLVIIKGGGYRGKLYEIVRNRNSFCRLENMLEVYIHE